MCIVRVVGAQFGFNQMISEEIKIPNRLVGLGKYFFVTWLYRQSNALDVNSGMYCAGRRLMLADIK